MKLSLVYRRWNMDTERETLEELFGSIGRKSSTKTYFRKVSGLADLQCLQLQFLLVGCISVPCVSISSCAIFRISSASFGIARTPVARTAAGCT